MFDFFPRKTRRTRNFFGDRNLKKSLARSQTHWEPIPAFPVLRLRNVSQGARPIESHPNETRPPGKLRHTPKSHHHKIRPLGSKTLSFKTAFAPSIPFEDKNIFRVFRAFRGKNLFVLIMQTESSLLLRRQKDNENNFRHLLPWKQLGVWLGAPTRLRTTAPAKRWARRFSHHLARRNGPPGAVWAGDFFWFFMKCSSLLAFQLVFCWI